MSGSIGLILDIVVIALLSTMIAFAAVLNRRLAAWRQDKGEFERLINEFNRAAIRAESGVERLKTGSEETGRMLQQTTTKGRALCDDLSYLLERAEPLADRLTDSVRAARAAATRNEPLPVVQAAEESPSEDGPEERARAKRELLRALAALR